MKQPKTNYTVYLVYLVFWGGGDLILFFTPQLYCNLLLIKDMKIKNIYELSLLEKFVYITWKWSG